MRISDWSSDVCSSDLIGWQLLHREQTAEIMRNAVKTAAMHDACAAVTGAVVMTQPHRIDEFRSEEHTSELQSLMRISYAVFCLKKKTQADSMFLQHPF